MLQIRRSTSNHARHLRRHLSTNIPPSSKPPIIPSSVNVNPPKHPSSIPPPTKTPLPSTSKDKNTKLNPALFLTIFLFPVGFIAYIKNDPSFNPESIKDNPIWQQFRSFIGVNDSILNDLEKTSIERHTKRTKEIKEAADNEEDSHTYEIPSFDEPKKSMDKESSLEKNATSLKDKVKEKISIIKKEEEETVKAIKEKIEEEKANVLKAKKEVEEKALKAKEEAEAKALKAKKEEEERVAQELKARELALLKAKEEEEERKKQQAMLLAQKEEEEQLRLESDPHYIERKELDKVTEKASSHHMREEMAKKIQTTAKELLSALQNESNASAFDIDEQYLANLSELDANTLAIRVAQLAVEMKHRSKWEAMRLIEALKRMEEETKAKSSDALRLQEELHQEILVRELRLQEEKLSRTYREELLALKKEYDYQLKKQVKTKHEQLEHEFHKKVASAEAKLQEKYHDELELKEFDMQNLLAKERTNRLRELEDYRLQLHALNAILDSTATYEAFSHQIHKTSVAALALSDRIERAAPLEEEIVALKLAAKNDEMIALALQSIPDEAIKVGAASVTQLTDRFRVVKKAARASALIPENAGLLSRMFGTGLSKILLPPGGPIAGDDVDAVFSRAEFALKAGDIENAVNELKFGLEGVPAEVARDWIQAAENRLAVEQTSKVMKAYIALLAESCA